MPYSTDLYTNELFLILGASGRARKSTVITMARRMLADGDSGVLGAFPNAVIQSDIGSVEGVQDLLQHKPRCLIAMEEFGDFLQKTSAPQHAQKRTMFNQLFDANPAGRIVIGRRMAQRSEASKNPRVTALVGCAPEYLVSHTRQLDWMGGFMSRWLTVYASDERKLEPSPPDATEIATLVKLLQVKERTKSTPRLSCAGQTPLAREIWLHWVKSTRKVVDGLLSRTAHTVLQRVEPHATKVALLLAWDLGEAYLDGWRMSARALAPAIHFANVHIRSIIKIINEIPANEDEAERMQVLAAIAEDPGITDRRHVLRAVRTLNAKKLLGHITTLMQAGLITVHGGVESDSVAFSRVPTATARIDHHDTIPLWAPDAAIVGEERGGEDALVHLQAETAETTVAADAAAPLDIII